MISFSWLLVWTPTYLQYCYGFSLQRRSGQYIPRPSRLKPERMFLISTKTGIPYFALQADKDNGLDEMAEATTDTPFGLLLRGILQTGMAQDIGVDSIVIAKADIPSLGIWMDQSYQVESIYLQGGPDSNNATEVVEKIPFTQLQSTEAISKQGRYTQYIKVFNPVYHEIPVVVTPEEMGLTSLREEVLDSILFALPVLGFWIATSLNFAKTYNERYGGNFFDAFWGR
jgi:hypothetical protein